jgi:hypothetical protein
VAFSIAYIAAVSKSAIVSNCKESKYHYISSYEKEIKIIDGLSLYSEAQPNE